MKPDTTDSPMKKSRSSAAKPAAAIATPPAAPPVDRAAPIGVAVDDAAKQQMRLIERRLQNPNVTDDRSITLKDKNLVVRIFNGEKQGRLYHAVHRLGWRPLRVDELVDREQIGDIQTSPEGYVTRGEKGREMFMVMPRDAFNQIQRKKVQLREKQQNLHGKGRRAQIDEIAEATANRFGSDEAGDTVRKFHGTNPDHSAVMELDS